MRVLRVLSPDADEPLAQSVREGVRAFNRGLDIRLRFLSIVVEDSELRVADPESAAELMGRSLEEFAPTVVLVQGGDASALAAATLAARTDAVVAHLAAGDRGVDDVDTARALDHVCGLLLALGESEMQVLRDEGLLDRARLLTPGEGLGHQVIKALRAERVRRRGDATC